MKKLLVVLTALSLPCFLVRAQEADDTATGVGLSIIPRLDLSPEFYDGKGDFTLGYSSLYSLFEGNISESLSFSVMNHWLGFYATDPLFDQTKSLYEGTFKRTNNWLDWANVTWSTGDFSLTLGKDMILVGGIEFDDYDVDVHPNVSSTLWNNFECYQWGARAGWSFAEEQTLSLQATLSPVVRKVFDKAVMNYSLGWNGNLAGIETIWSVTGMGLGEGKFAPMVSLGQRTEAGPFSIGLDVFYIDNTDSILDGVTVMPSATWSISDRFEFFAKCGYEKRTLSRFDDNFFVGGVLNYYPLQESQALRLHAAVSYYKDWATTCVNLGATWRFEFALGK